MMSHFPICLPPPKGSAHTPRWNGRAFEVGDLETTVLSYETGESGWTDELTEFHEVNAGDDHYIDRASQRHTISQLKRWVSGEHPAMMDIGCSSGSVLKLLLLEFPEATVSGADYVGGPLQALASRLPNVPLIQFDLTACPLPTACLDAVVLLNVLEHIEDDRAAVKHVARILKPGGIAVIEVPAGPELYDGYDKQLMHHRRYKMSDLIEKVSGSGLRILEKSHLGFFLYPPFWAVKMRGRRLLSENDGNQKERVSQQISSGRANPLLYKLMDWEAALRNKIYYPFGIRCLLTCQRP